MNGSAMQVSMHPAKLVAWMLVDEVFDPGSIAWWLSLGLPQRPLASDSDDPRDALEVFVFALGTAPMFFLLLMVRDLVGIHSQAMHEIRGAAVKVIQQKEFSYLSVTFFVFSVVAAVFSGDGGGNLPARDGRIHHNTVPGLLSAAFKLS